MTADAPRGAVELGGLITRAGGAATTHSGKDCSRSCSDMPRWAGLIRWGATGPRLEAQFPDRSLLLLALELEATLRVFDPDTAVRRAPPALLAALDSYSTVSSTLAARAALASGLLAVRSGDSVRARVAEDVLALGPVSLGAISRRGAWLSRERAGRSRRYRRFPDSKMRGVTTLRCPMRSYDCCAPNNSSGWKISARRERRCSGTSTCRPSDVAPAILRREKWAGRSGLARWRLANLRGVSIRERCSAYRAVARHWSDGMAPFKSRADSARTFVGQHCTQ